MVEIKIIGDGTQNKYRWKIIDDRRKLVTLAQESDWEGLQMLIIYSSEKLGPKPWATWLNAMPFWRKKRKDRQSRLNFDRMWLCGWRVNRRSTL